MSYEGEIEMEHRLGTVSEAFACSLPIIADDIPIAYL